MNYAFIDNENVNLSIQSQWWKIDWAKLRKRLEKEHNVWVAYMFMGYMPESQEMYNFFQTLGYTLIFKPMTGVAAGNPKWNTDAELVLQAMIDIKAYEQAVIISGDGDFACLVRYLYSQWKLDSLIVPNKRRYSELLKHAAKEKIHSLSPYKRQLAYVTRKRTPKAQTSPDAISKDTISRNFVSKDSMSKDSMSKEKLPTHLGKKPQVNTKDLSKKHTSE